MVGERYPILPLPHSPEHTSLIEVGPIARRIDPAAMSAALPEIEAAIERAQRAAVDES